MKYNLITLKMFLTVARTGSIAQASEAENVAASAISKRISDLEDQIGTHLFYQLKDVGGVPCKLMTRGCQFNATRLPIKQLGSNLIF